MTRPDLQTLHRQGKLETLPGIGAGIAKVLKETIETGASTYLERLRAESFVTSTRSMIVLSRLVESVSTSTPPEV